MKRSVCFAFNMMINYDGLIKLWSIRLNLISNNKLVWLPNAGPSHRAANQFASKLLSSTLMFTEYYLPNIPNIYMYLYVRQTPFLAHLESQRTALFLIAVLGRHSRVLFELIHNSVAFCFSKFTFNRAICPRRSVLLTCCLASDCS